MTAWALAAAAFGFLGLLAGLVVWMHWRWQVRVQERLRASVQAEVEAAVRAGARPDSGEPARANGTVRLPAGARACLYRRQGCEARGPVPLTTLRAMVADGRLEPDALAAEAGSDDWKPAAHFLRSSEDGRP